MQTSHPTMPNIIVAPKDMRNVIAYILSLKGREGSNLEHQARQNSPARQPAGNDRGLPEAAFGLARVSARGSKCLHLCAAAWQRLPYSTELSPFYSQELIDIGREQVSAEQREAKTWFDQALAAHPGATADFQYRRGFAATDRGKPRPRRRCERGADHCRAGRRVLGGGARRRPVPVGPAGARGA